MEAFAFPDLTGNSPIKPGALVEAKLDGKKVYYLLSPGGGGLTIEADDGELVTVLGTEAPLRGSLLDQKVGGRVERPPLVITGVM